MNKDGRVHQQEMPAYLERKLVGKSPEEVPDYIRAFTAAPFGFMDYDKTGKVSKIEFRAVPDEPEHHRQGRRGRVRTARP